MTGMPTASPLMVVAMMVAMMLPSIAPTLWRYYRARAATLAPRALEWTMLAGTGYVGVWTLISLTLFALAATLPTSGMASAMDTPLAPWAAGAIVFCAGALQRTRWKARHLARCRDAFATTGAVPGSIVSAWLDGVRLGLQCGMSCAAPTAVLFAAGMMEPRAMAVITTAITAERLAPAGARIARLTGALAIGVGLIICARAVTHA